MIDLQQAQQKLKKLRQKPHHYDMYGHEPGCGVCYAIQNAQRDIDWIKGCPAGHPWTSHLRYVGGFSGVCPRTAYETT